MLQTKSLCRDVSSIFLPSGLFEVADYIPLRLASLCRSSRLAGSKDDGKTFYHRFRVVDLDLLLATIEAQRTQRKPKDGTTRLLISLTLHRLLQYLIRSIL